MKIHERLLCCCVLFITCMTVSCDSLHQPALRHKPVFTVHPQNAFGLLKRSLSLSCRADGEPPPLITWYKDSHQVQSVRERPGTSNKIIKSEELMFLSFEQEDEGTYYCNASNAEGWTQSEYANISLAFLDSIIEGPLSQVTSVGETVIFKCKIPHGLPVPVINWYHNTESVKISSRFFIIDGNLHISNVQRKDTGTYQCEARNRAGRQESQVASLTVHQKPHFEIKPSNQQVKVGEDVEFFCRANGDPKPSILWRRENDHHIPEDRSVLRDDNGLRIFQVRREDAGTYVCQAKNEAGSADASAKLLVLSPPSFTITPIDTTVSEGQEAVFYCQASGSPPPYVRWAHNGEYFLYPDFRSPHLIGRPRVFVNHEGSLVVTSTRKSDEGKYECRASHKTGMVRSSANLFVSDSNPPPIVFIDLGPQNQTCLLGTTATLRCEAHLLGSNSPPARSQDSYGVTVSWLKNGFNIMGDSDPRIVLLSQGTLQINNVNILDEGNYTCRAEIAYLPLHQQTFSPTEWTASLHISLVPLHPAYQVYISENLPRPPASVDIVEVGDSSISLKCNFSPLPVSPVFGDVQNDRSLNEFSITIPSAQVVERTRVRIEYIEIKGNDGWVVAAEARPAEIVRITGLKPESGYRVLARTVSPRGVGRPHVLPHTVYTKRHHRFVNFTNYPTDHLSAVSFSIPKLTSLSISEVELSGRICGDNDVITMLTGIRIRYWPLPLDQCLVFDRASVLDPADDCSNYLPPSFDSKISLPGLESFSENYCSLQMFPEKGFEYAQSMSGGQFKLSDQVENYRLIELNLVDSAPFRVVLDNLSPFICYEVEVGAYSEDRALGRVYSQRSRVSRVLTFDSTPSQAPKDVKTRWIGLNDEILEVVWVHPSVWSINGFLTGFSLRLLGKHSEQRTTLRVGPTLTSYRIDSLQPKVNYTLYIAAVTCHGEGVRSEPHPIIASHYLKLMGRNASQFFSFSRHPDDADSTGIVNNITLSDFSVKSSAVINGSHYRSNVAQGSGFGAHYYTWIIVCFVGIGIIWFLIFIGVLVCRRQQRHRTKQRYPQSSGVTEDVNYRIARSGASRNSMVGLLDARKENGLGIQQVQQQPVVAPIGLIAHGSPRLQMGTGILNSPRAIISQRGDTAGADYEAPASQPETVKLTSAGSIFLATGGTTSSSSQNSSIHKGAGEARITAEGNLESRCVNDVEDDSDIEDPSSVSPYASASLIEQLRRGGGPFLDVIPPPPCYPPPSVPPDSPPTTPKGGTATPYQTFASDEYHYALSDLKEGENPVFMSSYGSAPPYHGYAQEQYWGNSSPGGMCYMQQPVVTLPNQNATLYAPHLMGNGLAPVQTIRPTSTLMTQQRGPQSFHNQHPPGLHHHHHHLSSGDPYLRLPIPPQPTHPSSVLADDMVLPPSTLTQVNRKH